MGLTAAYVVYYGYNIAMDMYGRKGKNRREGEEVIDVADIVEGSTRREAPSGEAPPVAGDGAGEACRPAAPAMGGDPVTGMDDGDFRRRWAEAARGMFPLDSASDGEMDCRAMADCVHDSVEQLRAHGESLIRVEACEAL